MKYQIQMAAADNVRGSFVGPRKKFRGGCERQCVRLPLFICRCFTFRPPLAIINQPKGLVAGECSRLLAAPCIA
jgi:hypothetical protein